MLTISSAQMSAIENARILAFEDRTCAHLKQYFPRHHQVLGEAPLRRVIRLGLQKAKSHDLTAECCVRAYIESMCLLGSGFDTDPLLPWAAAILNDKSAFGQVERGDRLHEQVWDYVDYVSQDYMDSSGQPAVAQLAGEIRGLRQGHDEILAEEKYPEFATQLAWRIENAFPAKCRYVGGKRIRDLIPRGVKSAWSYGITSERGITLFTVFLFVLGNGFADDPLLPWASAALNDKLIVSEVARTDRLYAEGVGFLKRWWEAAPKPGA